MNPSLGQLKMKGRFYFTVLRGNQYFWDNDLGLLGHLGSNSGPFSSIPHYFAPSRQPMKAFKPPQVSPTYLRDCTYLFYCDIAFML